MYQNFDPFKEITDGATSLGIADRIASRIPLATGDYLVELWAAGLCLLDTRYPHDPDTCLRTPKLPVELKSFEEELRLVSPFGR